MIKKLSICLTLGFLLCVSGCRIYTQYDIDQAYDHGYESGQKDGYDAGYYAGKESAESSHEWNCYNEDDLVESYAEGYQDAERYYEDEVIADVQVDSFCDGYDYGYDDGTSGEAYDPESHL